jgi:hypothetical protein
MTISAEIKKFPLRSSRPADRKMIRAVSDVQSAESAEGSIIKYVYNAQRAVQKICWKKDTAKKSIITVESIQKPDNQKGENRDDRMMDEGASEGEDSDDDNEDYGDASDDTWVGFGHNENGYKKSTRTEVMSEADKVEFLNNQFFSQHELTKENWQREVRQIIEFCAGDNRLHQWHLECDDAAKEQADAGKESNNSDGVKGGNKGGAKASGKGKDEGRKNGENKNGNGDKFNKNLKDGKSNKNQTSNNSKKSAVAGKGSTKQGKLKRSYGDFSSEGEHGSSSSSSSSKALPQNQAMQPPAEKRAKNVGATDSFHLATTPDEPEASLRERMTVTCRAPEELVDYILEFWRNPHASMQEYAVFRDEWVQECFDQLIEEVQFSGCVEALEDQWDIVNEGVKHWDAPLIASGEDVRSAAQVVIYETENNICPRSFYFRGNPPSLIRCDLIHDVVILG